MVALGRYRSPRGSIGRLDAAMGAVMVSAGWVALDVPAEAAAEAVPEVEPEAIEEPEVEPDGSEDFTNSDAGLTEASPAKRGRTRKPAAN